MNRTRLIFISIIVLALVVVGVSLALRASGSGTGAALTVEKPDTVTVRVITALPVEEWVSKAAASYNAGSPTIDGVPIQVEIVGMDGLTALGKWDRNEYGSLADGLTPEQVAEAQRTTLANFPTVWIPDSRYLVELANASYKERLGRDVFLTDGEYRARPIAVSLFTWGIYDSRATVLEQKYGDVSWETIHAAAIAKGGWPELGGDRQLGLLQAGGAQPVQKCGRLGGHDRGGG